ncbi:uncharacterized protein LOC102364771 [Latimeria chalumnae]|uniref:uncharacterized protein LOC102364771 n=1 Tax=Latimeria chalumnae TaxID=7897 RepID=UPI00313D5059
MFYHIIVVLCCCCVCEALGGDLLQCRKENPSPTVRAGCGDSVLLQCPFTWKGNPPDSTRVVWQTFRGGREEIVHYQNGVKEDEKQVRRYRGRTDVPDDWFEERNPNLTVSPVGVDDGGIYKCYIITIDPHENMLCAQFSLVVDIERSCLIRSSSLSGKEGEEVKIKCPIKDSCDAQIWWGIRTEAYSGNITWTSEGDRVPSHYVMTGHMLLLRQASSKDNGEYICYLEGSCCSDIHVTVTESELQRNNFIPVAIAILIIIAFIAFIIALTYIVAILAEKKTLKIPKSYCIYKPV